MKLKSFISPKAQTQRFINRKVASTKKYVEKKVSNDDISDPEVIGKQAKSIARMYRMYPAEKLLEARWNLLKDDSFPDDIRKLRGMTGWSDEQIIEHYWGREEFQDLWRLLSMDKDNLEFCVKVMSRNPDWENEQLEDTLVKE